MRDPRGWRGFGRRLSRRGMLGGAVSGAATGAMLAGCGTRGKDRGAGGSAPPAGAVQQARRGGKLSIPATIDPYNWDMSYLGKSPPNNWAAVLMNESLLTFKTGSNVKYEDQTLVPNLAERYETPDVQVYTFHLRKGVRFWNTAPVNGRELTSADVKWTYEYYSRSGRFANKNLPEAQFAWMFEGIDKVETPDDSTAVVRFSKPFAPFRAYAASFYNPIVPHEIDDQYGDLQNHVASLGPWQLDSDNSVKGSRWIWKRNPTYWQPGKPYVDEVDWVVIPDESTARAAFQTRQIDLISADSPAGAKTIQQANPKAASYKYANPLPQYLHLNTRRAPLDDMRVRRAVAYSIDHQELLNVITDGQGQWALCGAVPGTFTQDEIRQMLEYDPADARQLLASAGYPNGLDIDFYYATNVTPSYLQEIQLLQTQLQKGGIRLHFKTFEYADFTAKKKQHDFWMLTDSGQPQDDIGTNLYASFHPSSKADYDGVNDPDLTKLLYAQLVEPDLAKRTDLIRQAVRRINVDMVWSQALMLTVNYHFWQPRVKNYAPNENVPGWPVRESWVEG